MGAIFAVSLLRCSLAIDGISFTTNLKLGADLEGFWRTEVAPVFLRRVARHKATECAYPFRQGDRIFQGGRHHPAAG